VGGLLAPRVADEARFLVARHQQRVAGGTLGPRELDRRVEATFAGYARYWTDSARLADRSEAEVDAGFTVEGFEHIENAFEAGVGPILVLPHLGGWEWAGRWLLVRPRYAVSVVVEPLEPQELFEWMVEFREGYGMQVIPLGPQAGAATMAVIKANHVTCLLADRDLSGGGGIPVNFFDEVTTIPAGPATLGLRTGAHLIPVGVYHDGPRTHAICRPPVPAERTGSFRSDVAKVTQAIVDELAWLIRQAPEQWHLLQPNWPSDHEALAAYRSARGCA
jgi:phosphatidylinositol dimannoside acyltransferase